MSTVDFEPLTVTVPHWEDPPGVFRVGDSRVLLELVLDAFKRGESPEAIDLVIELLVDQNFNGDLVDELTRRDATLDMIQFRDVGLAAAPGVAILEWASTHGMVLLTHDRKTIPSFAYARVAAGLPMPGVFLVSNYNNQLLGTCLHAFESGGRSCPGPSGACHGCQPSTHPPGPRRGRAHTRSLGWAVGLVSPDTRRVICTDRGHSARQGGVSAGAFPIRPAGP